MTLLSDLGIALALVVAAAVGAFGVRRRQTEAALLFARGEHVLVYGARSAIESFLPVLFGALAGFGLADALTGILAPSGTVDPTTFEAALEHAAAATVAALALLAAASGLSFLRLHDTGTRSVVLLRFLPWELPVLAAGLYLLLRIPGGGGLAASGTAGTAHPTLAVFALPLLLVAGSAGLAARLARLALRRSPRRSSGLPVPVFLALRRLGAGGALLVALTVVLAVSFGAFFYAQTLSASLAQSTSEKGYIGIGSDVEGQVGSLAALPPAFPYPATTVAWGNGAKPSTRRTESRWTC